MHAVCCTVVLEGSRRIMSESRYTGSVGVAEARSVATVDTTVVACVYDASAVWTAELGGWVRRRHHVSGDVTAEFQMKDGVDPTCISITADELWVGLSNGGVAVADTRSVQLHTSGELQESAIDHDDSITCIAMDTNHVVTGCNAGFVVLRNRRDRSLLWKLRIRSQGPVGAVVLLPSETAIVTHDDTHRLIIVDINQRTILSAGVGHTSDILSLCHMPQRRTVWSGSVDETIRCWRYHAASSELQCVATIAHHSGAVHAIHLVSPSIVLSASLDGLVALWDDRQSLLHSEYIGTKPVGSSAGDPLNTSTRKHFAFCAAGTGLMQFPALWLAVTDGTMRSVAILDAAASPHHMLSHNTERIESEELEALRKRVPFTEQELAAFLLEKKLEFAQAAAASELYRVTAAEEWERLALQLQESEECRCALWWLTTGVSEHHMSSARHHRDALRSLQDDSNVAERLLQQRAEESSRRAAQLELSVTEADRTTRLLRDDIRALRQQVEHSTTELQELHVVVEEGKRLVAERDSKICSLHGEVESLRDQLTCMTEEATTLRDILSDTTSREFDKENIIMELERNRDAQMADMQAQCKELSRSLQQVTAELVASQHATSSERSLSTSLQARLDEALTTVQEATIERASLAQLLDQTRAQLIDMEQRSSHLEREVVDMEETFRSTRLALDNAERLRDATVRQGKSIQSSALAVTLRACEREALVAFAHEERCENVAREMLTLRWRSGKDHLRWIKAGAVLLQTLSSAASFSSSRLCSPSSDAADDIDVKFSALNDAAHQLVADLLRTRQRCDELQRQSETSMETIEELRGDLVRSEAGMMTELQHVTRRLEEDHLVALEALRDEARAHEQDAVATVRERFQADASTMLRMAMSAAQEEFDREISCLRQQLDDARSTNETLAFKLGSAQEHVGRLEQGMCALEEQYESHLRATEVRLQSEVVAFASEAANNRARCNELEVLIQQLHARDAAQRAEINALQELNKSVTQHSLEAERNLAERIDALAREVEHWSEMSQKASDACSNVERALQMSHRDNEALRREVEQERALRARELEQRARADEYLANERDEKEAEISALGSKVALLSKRLAEAVRDNESLLSKVDAERHSVHEITGEMQSREEMWLQRCAVLEKEAMQCAERERDARHTIRDLQQLVRALEDDCRRASETSSALARDAGIRAAEFRELTESHRHMLSLQDEASRMSRELQRTESELRKVLSTQRDKDELLKILAQEVNTTSNRRFF